MRGSVSDGHYVGDETGNRDVRPKVSRHPIHYEKSTTSIRQYDIMHLTWLIHKVLRSNSSILLEEYISRTFLSVRNYLRMARVQSI